MSDMVVLDRLLILLFEKRGEPVSIELAKQQKEQRFPVLYNNLHGRILAVTGRRSFLQDARPRYHTS